MRESVIAVVCLLVGGLLAYVALRMSGRLKPCPCASSARAPLASGSVTLPGVTLPTGVQPVDGAQEDIMGIFFGEDV